MKCDKCGTSDFSVPTKVCDFGFTCPDCDAVMCVQCADTKDLGGVTAFRCYRCGGDDLREEYPSDPTSVPKQDSN